MKFLKHIRSRSRVKDQPEAQVYTPQALQRNGPGPTSALPTKILRRIFAHVCPHALDDSYKSSEESMIDETGCVLCDIKDLAQCALVSKRWHKVAQDLM